MGRPTDMGSQPRRPQQEKSRLEIWLGFVFGVIFVAILLYLATVEKNPTPLAIRVYVTVLALAGGGIGAVLPGFLEIQYKGFARTGGAIALTALIYLNEPAIGKNVVNFVEPKTPAEPVVTEFLNAVDSEDPHRSWALLSEGARQHVSGSETAWNKLYANDVAPLGHVESRTLIGQQQAESPPSAPPGLYRSYTYKTKYAADAGPRLESVTLRANSNDRWEIYSYLISPTTLPNA
jgi:Protein of unknown function (DUF4019)